jgi:hypothetical protein
VTTNMKLIKSRLSQFKLQSPNKQVTLMSTCAISSDTIADRLSQWPCGLRRRTEAA